MNVETNTGFNSLTPYNPKVNNETGKIVRKGFASRDSKNDYENQIIISENEEMYLNYLLDLKRNLNSGNLVAVSQTMQALMDVEKMSKESYVETILRPESTRGAKIPTIMPLPSASFQLRQSFNVSTNALGNAALMINPFYLASSATNSTVCVNNNVGLDGTTSSNFFLPVAIGQDIPAVYSQYRLVSGSLICKYIGRLDIVQGIIGGAVIYDQSLTASVTGTPVAGLAKYGNFNTARDSYFNQECYALQGLREIYFPLDTSFDEYLPLGTSKNGFNFFVYIQNCPPSTASFKFDLALNFECLADSTFLNYIPVSISDGPVIGKEYLKKMVQDQIIQPESNSLWKKITTGISNTFNNVVGGLINKGLTSITEKMLSAPGA